MIEIQRFSVGIGDRFGHEGEAQLGAFTALEGRGVVVTPVWNKSNREHRLCGTTPQSVRDEADSAVATLGWRHAHLVDADHVGLANIEPFLRCSDFFTIDVADSIGAVVDDGDAEEFAARHAEPSGFLSVPGIHEPLLAGRSEALTAARTYLAAIREAGRIHRRIESARGAGTFVAEVSMDEAAAPQAPVELWFVLRGLAEEGVRVQTIAPRFSGRFLKGIDFVGDVRGFEREFEVGSRIARHAVEALGLPRSLKLSVHSGSDKFALYPAIAAVMHRTGAGVHLKTAGTTWLEEVIGLAETGGEALAVAQVIYRGAHARLDELIAPYASVVAIDRDNLPTPDAVDRRNGSQFAAALRHEPRSADFDRDFRQVMHIAFRIAAEMGTEFTDALAACGRKIGSNVTHNLLERHLVPLFLKLPR